MSNLNVFLKFVLAGGLLLFALWNVYVGVLMFIVGAVMSAHYLVELLSYKRRAKL